MVQNLNVILDISTYEDTASCPEATEISFPVAHIESPSLLQAHVAAVLENTDDLIAAFDQDLRLLMCNMGYRQFILSLKGVEAQAGMALYTLLPSQLAHITQADCTRALAGERFCKEYAFDFAPGDHRIFDVSFTPVSHNGQIVGVSQFARNITQHKQVEALQQRRNQELMMLNRASHALNSTLDLDAILVMVLEEVRNLLNVFASSIWLIDEDTGDLICRQATGPHSKKVHGWRLPAGQGIAGYVAQTGASLLVSDTQTDQRHFAGVAKHIQQDLRSLITVPLYAKQKVIGVLQVVDQQIERFSRTDMTLLEPLAVAAGIAIENARLVEGLEEEVASRTAEIVAERDKSQAILQSVGEAIAMVNATLHIQYVNPAFEKLIGYPATEILQRNIQDFISDTCSVQILQAMTQAYENGQKWQGEVPMQRKDGRPCDMALVSVPTCDANGQLLGYVISHQDISRFKKLDHARRQFIINVSHQFRTPVTTLKAQVYLMQKVKQAPRNEYYLMMMEKQIKILIQLIEDIIAMTVLDSGQSIRTWEIFDLNTVILSLLDRYSRQASAAGLALRMVTQLADALTVRGDQDRIMQALGKMLDNAIKFTPSGGEISLSGRRITQDDRTWSSVSLQDAGPGIPADEQVHVFERFFKGSIAASGHVPGTGLGLSFAQEIAHAHGGRITVASDGQQGTQFTLCLPFSAE